MRSTGKTADETLTDDALGRTSAALPNLVAPHLFVALECGCPAAGVARHSLANIDRVLIGRGSGHGRTAVRTLVDGLRTLELRVPDRRVSTSHACLTRKGACFNLTDLGSRNGTGLNGDRVAESTPLIDGELVLVGHTLIRYRGDFVTPLGEPGDVDLSRGHGGALLFTADPILSRRS